MSPKNCNANEDNEVERTKERKKTESSVKERECKKEGAS